MNPDGSFFPTVPAHCTPTGTQTTCFIPALTAALIRITVSAASLVVGAQKLLVSFGNSRSVFFGKLSGLCRYVSEICLGGVSRSRSNGGHEGRRRKRFQIRHIAAFGILPAIVNT